MPVIVFSFIVIYWRCRRFLMEAKRPVRDAVYSVPFSSEFEIACTLFSIHPSRLDVIAHKGENQSFL
jgi:hypothetical protein